MFRCSTFAGMVILGMAVLVGTGSSQDAKKGDAPPAKTKTYLPPGWKDLALTKEQQVKVSEIHGVYKAKVKLLEDQIKETKGQERQEMVKILTAEQKEKATKIFIGEDAKGEPKDDKKAPEKK